MTTSSTTSSRSNWMLYGAYGTTGRLILDEALRRGHRPVLAGRDRAKLSALGEETGLSTLHLSLDDGNALREALSRVQCVLLAAGPYEVTGPAMRAACLDVGCSYLDVNAEIGDFTAAFASDVPARAAGIGIIPGVGYGVVFGESLAAQVALRLPDATWLRLSFATQTEGSSRSARLSTAAAIAAGGREIRAGSLRKRALAFSTWRAPAGKAAGNGDAKRFAAAPMAEMYAAYRSTGIPNITAGIPLPRVAAAFLRVAGPLLGKVLLWQAARASRTAEPRSFAETSVLRSRVWAEAGNAAGERVVAMLETGEGYRAAAATAVRAVELQLSNPQVGALTPAQAFGPRFALLVPNTFVRQIDNALAVDASALVSMS
jgi:short subunit dehydrogenase-like uncharacterized protein